MAGHWIGGAECAGLGAGRFEAPGAEGQLEPWPRAQAADFQRALLEPSLLEAARAWADLGDGERRRAVAARLEAWAEVGLALPAGVGEGCELTRAYLAAEARELAALARELREPLAFGALPPPSPPPRSPSAPVAVLFAHALLGPGGIYRLAARALAQGWPLLVVGDENLPLPAHHLGALSGGLPKGLVSVLHGGPLGLADHWPGGPIALLGALSARQDCEGFCLRARGQGAPWVELGPPAGRVLDLPVNADPGQAAGEVLEQAFGAERLGGQLVGSAVLVRAPARVFGALVEELFARWPKAESWPGPLDPGAPAARAGRLTRALDEGATLVLGEMTTGRARPAWGPALVVNAEYAPRTSAERTPLGVLFVARC